MPLFLHPDPALERETLAQVEVTMASAAARRDTFARRGTAGRAAAAVERHPGLPLQVLIPAAQIGVDPDDQRLFELDQRVLAEEAGAWDRAKAAARATVRGAFTVFDTAWEEIVARPYRASVTAVTEAGGPSWLAGPVPMALSLLDPEARQAAGEAYAQTPSAGAVAARQALSGEPVDLGAGFFPAGTAGAEARARASAVVPDEAQAGRQGFTDEFVDRLRQYAAEAPTFRGQPISPGRVTASHITEPGTREHAILSGLVDFGAQIVADPANVALGGLPKRPRPPGVSPVSSTTPRVGPSSPGPWKAGSRIPGRVGDGRWWTGWPARRT